MWVRVHDFQVNIYLFIIYIFIYIGSPRLYVFAEEPIMWVRVHDLQANIYIYLLYIYSYI